MAKDKPGNTEITQRFLLLMDEVIKSGACENKGAFANSVGEYQQNLSTMERGNRAPTLLQVAKACEVYGYSANWLLLNIGNKKLNPNEAEPLENRVNQMEQDLKKLQNLVTKQLSIKNQ